VSNILNRNPIYLDTALQSYKSSVASVQGTRLELIVLKIRWVAPNAGDVLEFVDPQSGNVLAMMSAKTTGLDVEEDLSPAPRIWSDFGVPAVNSGKVFVYTK
jgi:hypothetical protein